MSALSNYAENALLELIVGKTAFATPSVSVALYTTAPTDSTAGVEVAGGGYTRMATAPTDWTAASDGSISNAVDFEWDAATGSWGSVVAVALVDDSDNVLVYGDAASAKTIEENDVYRIQTGNLSLSLD